jgi:hypothetical protein
MQSQSENPRPSNDAPQTVDDAGRKREEDLDETSTQSFPASDPPSSTAVHAGPPRRFLPIE